MFVQAAVVPVHAAAPSLSPAATAPAPGGLLAAAIEHLEREPASVAADEAPLAALSPRELHLVLIKFAQEGRDAYPTASPAATASPPAPSSSSIRPGVSIGEEERRRACAILDQVVESRRIDALPADEGLAHGRL